MASICLSVPKRPDPAAGRALERGCRYNAEIDSTLAFVSLSDVDLGAFTRQQMPETTDAFDYVKAMEQRRARAEDALVAGQIVAIWRARQEAMTGGARVWGGEASHRCTEKCTMEEQRVEVFSCSGGARDGMHHICVKAPGWICTFCRDSTVHTCKTGRVVSNIYVCSETGLGHVCFPGACEGPHVLTGYSRTCMVTGRSIQESTLTVGWADHRCKNALTESEHGRGNYNDQCIIDFSARARSVGDGEAAGPSSGTATKKRKLTEAHQLPPTKPKTYHRAAPTEATVRNQHTRVTAMVSHLLPGGGQRKEMDASKIRKSMSYCTRIFAKTVSRSLQSGELVCLEAVREKMYLALFKPCNYVDRRVHTNVETAGRLCEMYAATVVEWWYHLARYVRHVSWPPVHMTCEVFGLCALHMSKRGMTISGVEMVPRDEFLASQLSGATALRALSAKYGMRAHDSAFTNTCKEIRGLLFEIHNTLPGTLESYQMLPYDLTTALTTSADVWTAACAVREERLAASMRPRE